MNKVLLVGATGATGKLVLERLLADSAFTEVYVIARKALGIEHPKLKCFQVDFEELDQFTFPSGVVSVDQMYFCYGTTIKKAGGAEAFRHQEWDLSQRILTLGIRLKIKRLLLVSAMGANQNSRILYSKIKGKIEIFSRQIGYPEVVVFRPSLLIADRAELRVGELLAQKLTSPLMGILQKHLPKLGPVSTAVLADALIYWGKKTELPASFVVLNNQEIIHLV